MALGYDNTLRSNMMNQITTLVDAGSGNAILKIYDGARPSDLGPETNILATLTFDDPSFQGAANGVLTANTIAPDTSTPRGGLATWFRVEDSNGNPVFDGGVGLTGSGADLIMNDTTIIPGQRVEIPYFAIIEGNA